VSERFSPLTRGLALFALLCTLGLSGILAVSGQRGVADELRLFAVGVQGVDSWRPMNQAHTHLASGAERPLYAWLFFDQKIKFIYPPTSLLLIDAFAALFSKSGLRAALNVFSWLLVLITAAVSAALLDRLAQAFEPARARNRTDRSVRIALTFALALAFYPVLKAYTLGQMQVLLNALFAGFLYAWVAGWKRAAGVGVALMTAVKPHYGAFVLWGLLRRERSFALAAISAGAALLALSVARFGLASHLDYLSVVGEVSRLGEAYWPNQTWNGFLHRLLGNGVSSHWDPHVYPPYHPVVHAGSLIAAGLLLAAALFVPARGRRGSACDLCAMALALTMASPVAWEHHYGVLLPIFAVLLVASLREPVLGCATVPLLALAAAVASHPWLALGALSGTAWNPLQSLLLLVALASFALALALSVGGGDPRESGARVASVPLSPLS
jgi:hypothetical protein